jgi:hypothetical protein
MKAPAFDWKVHVITRFSEGFVPDVHLTWSGKTVAEVIRQIDIITRAAQKQPEFARLTVIATGEGKAGGIEITRTVIPLQSSATDG